MLIGINRKYTNLNKMDAVDYLNKLHQKHALAFEEGKISKERYDEFLSFYHEIASLYKKLSL